MIRNIQLNHGGKYVCLIDTDVESLSADAILVVKGRNKLSSLYVYIHKIYLLPQWRASCEVCISIKGHC